jgi:hypothetical protein
LSSPAKTGDPGTRSASTEMPVSGLLDAPLSRGMKRNGNESSESQR